LLARNVCADAEDFLPVRLANTVIPAGSTARRFP